MFTLIIDILADVVVRTIDVLGYQGVFFLMLVESCGIPMPSEIIMPFSGFLVAVGKMNFWIVSFVGAFANLAGSLIAYWIGQSEFRKKLIASFKRCPIAGIDDIRIIMASHIKPWTQSTKNTWNIIEVKYLSTISI